MIKCPKCGLDTREDKKFCSHCGSPLAITQYCPQCKSELEPTDLFCASCGFQLKPENQSYKPPQAIGPSPEEKTVEEKIQEGESFRKHVTVLVADIKSSTELIGTLDPEEIKEIISPAMEKLSSLVYEYGGLVVSSAGDEIVAVFGAVAPLENQSLRACLASLAMQKQIKSITKALTLRIGLNTGEVVLAVDGSKYDIAGAVVSLAARMDQTAKPDTIRLTENTLKLVADSVTVENLGPMEIKGFTELIEVYELKGFKLSKTLNELANQFIERTPFVNREPELAKLTTLLEEAKSGKGNAVGLFADPGFGKSRFIFEVANSAIAKDCNVLFTAGFIHTKNIPLLPIRNLFRSLFGILSNETDVENIKKQILPFLTHVESPLALNAVLSLINLSPDDPKWIALEAALKRKYMFEIGIKIIFNNTLEKALILIVEDMHWVDTETEMFLDALLSQISKFKIFILISYRPDYHDHFINRTNYTRIQLEPLTTKAGSKMLENLIGNDPSLGEIKSKILTTVEGNPFFLEEVVDTLISEKVIVGEPKKYHIREGTSVIKLSLPETIVAIVQTKIDKLPPREKKILQVASVIGTKFIYSQVVQLLEAVDEAEIRMSLNKLCEAQYIYESQVFPEPGFAFTQAVTLEIAYNSMLKKTRKNLHMKFFQILESTLKVDQIDQVQIIAEHAFLGENWEKAFYYCFIAAQKVFDINGFLACIKIYERALVAAEHLPQDDATVLKTMRIHYELYCALVPLGRFKEQYFYLQKSLEIALAKKDRFFESIINSAFGIHYLGYKDVNISLKHCEKAYLIGKEVRSTDAIMISLAILAHCYFFLGQFKELFTCVEELETTIGGNLEYRTEWLRAPIPHIALFYEYSGKAVTGDFAFVEGRKEKWFAGSPNLNEPSIANCCRFGSLGVNFYVKGDFEKAVQYLLTALQYSAATEIIVYVPIFTAMLGEINARINKVPEAKECVAKAMGIIEKLHANFTTVFSFPPILNCLLLLGEYTQAKQFCDNSIKILKERNITILLPVLLRMSAEIDLYLPNPNQTEIKEKLEEALQMTAQQGMLPSLGHCHLVFARLYQMMGDSENRKNELKSALSQYEKLGMPYWIDHVKKIGL